MQEEEDKQRRSCVSKQFSMAYLPVSTFALFIVNLLALPLARNDSAQLLARKIGQNRMKVRMSLSYQQKFLPGKLYTHHDYLCPCGLVCDITDIVTLYRKF